MKIKLDENIPLQVQFPLLQLGHEVDPVPEENNAGCSDEDV